VKAEERANQKAGALVNRWIEPVYCDSEADGGFALHIPIGDEGRKYVQRLQELVADEILVAQRKEKKATIERCVRIVSHTGAMGGVLKTIAAIRALFIGVRGDIVTMNERIAEWAGWIQVECEDNDSNLYLEWRNPVNDCNEELPAFDTDITLWHGEDGLLAEIGRKEKILDFTFELQLELHAVPQDGLTPGEVALLYWLLRRAEPAQLAAALGKVIEEECTTG